MEWHGGSKRTCMLKYVIKPKKKKYISLSLSYATWSPLRGLFRCGKHVKESLTRPNATTTKTKVRKSGQNLNLARTLQQLAFFIV